MIVLTYSRRKRYGQSHRNRPEPSRRDDGGSASTGRRARISNRRDARIRNNRTARTGSDRYRRTGPRVVGTREELLIIIIGTRTHTRTRVYTYYNIQCQLFAIKASLAVHTYQMYLRREAARCTVVVRQRVIRRKSQHPDMWAVLMTRLHVHYWRSDPRRSPPLYAKSERQAGPYCQGDILW